MVLGLRHEQTPFFILYNYFFNSLYNTTKQCQEKSWNLFIEGDFLVCHCKESRQSRDEEAILKGVRSPIGFKKRYYLFYSGVTVTVGGAGISRYVPPPTSYNAKVLVTLKSIFTLLGCPLLTTILTVSCVTGKLSPAL